MAIASTPRWGREPCAARPRTATSDQTNPLWATTSWSWGRLRDDRGVGPHGGKDLLDADARVLLVGDRGNHDVAGESPRRRLAAGQQRCGEAGLHVVGAAAVEAIAVHPWRVRAPDALHGHGVVVAAQEQPASRAGSAGANDDARPPGSALEHLGLETTRACPPDHERRDLALARASGDQRRIDRVDRDQSRENLGGALRHRTNADARALKSVHGDGGGEDRDSPSAHHGRDRAGDHVEGIPGLWGQLLAEVYRFVRGRSELATGDGDGTVAERDALQGRQARHRGRRARVEAVRAPKGA